MKLTNTIFIGLLYLFIATTSYAATNSWPTSFLVNETWASGWIPPASWKLVYPDPVLQTEVIGELKTTLAWPRSIRLTAWIQNPLQGVGAFNPPAGEVDYALGASGPIYKGVNLSTELRYIDRAGNHADVGRFGDFDLLRMRLRLERPFVFWTNMTLTPSFMYYRFEPIGYRPKTEGNTYSPQVQYEWKPYSCLRVVSGIGYMYDDGENGWIHANMYSYWFQGGLRLNQSSPECWVNASFQRYYTEGHPFNRPYRDFNLIALSCSLRF